MKHADTFMIVGLYVHGVLLGFILALVALGGN